jgi:hypothetical protein
LYFLTVSGVAATRVSALSVSERTAIRIHNLLFGFKRLRVFPL